MIKKYDIMKFIDGEFSLDVNVSSEEDTVWMDQRQIAALYDKARSTISEHIKNIFKDFELDESQVCRKNRQTGPDGKIYEITLYNLDVVLAVGYRAKSKRGILFRNWVTSILKAYMSNGYSLNSKRLQNCETNLISLQNEINSLNIIINNTLSRLAKIENQDIIFSDKIFFENKIFDAYSFVKKIFLDATESIIIIDNYIDISVLNMLDEINIPIIIYTLPSAHISNEDIKKFQISHNLSIIKSNIMHDRIIIIDNEVYSIGSSIKDIGKKRSIITKLTIKPVDLLKDL